MARNTEFTLGLLGGIFGFLGATFALIVGGLGAAFTGDGSIVGLAIGGFLFSILGIVGAVIVKSKAKLGGWIMIISAIGGLISISFAFFLSFILLLIGGIVALVTKDKK